MLDQLRAEPLIEENDLPERERPDIRDPGIVARALQNHFAVGGVSRREMRIGSAAHHGIDYPPDKKSAAILEQALKSREFIRENVPRFVPVMSLIAATVFAMFFPLA